MPDIQFEPPIIDSKLGHRKNDYPIVIEPKTKINSLSIAFSLKVVFQPKEISANFGNDKYYIGIRNANIEIIADNGKCIDATGDSIFDVEYVVDAAKTEERSEKVNTESQITSNPVSIGTGQEYSSGKIKERKTSAKFSTSEKKLSVKMLNNWVKWYYGLPNNDSLTIDLLDEILDLEATFKWNSAPLKGLIHVKPGKVAVFDSEKKRYPKFQYLAMIQVLIHKQFRIHKGNIQIKYQVS